MTWGNAANVTTVNLDSGTDDPSQARAEIYNALVELQAVINGRGATSGVAPLDGSGKITADYLPNTITSSVSNNLTLDPATGIVVIEDVLSLTAKTTTELESINAAAGSMAYCSDGDGGLECLAVSSGTQDSAGGYIWYRVALGVQINASS